MIREPKLHCNHCYSLKEKHKLKPRCETPIGCPIEDLAGDPQITDFCNKFNLAKGLFVSSELPQAQERIFKELELFENPYLWLQMESIYAEARARRRKIEDDHRRKDRK